MRNIDLRDMAALAEVVGTIGLVISLLFVAYSINRNTEEVQASQSNSIFEATREIELAVASDAEWSAIVLEARNDKNSMSDLDRFRYDAYLVMTIDTWDQLLNRYEAQIFDETAFLLWNEYFESWARRHLEQGDWHRISWQYGDPIKTRIDAILASETANSSGLNTRE